MSTLRRRAPLAFSALLTGCLIAACGSSSSTTSTTSTVASTGARSGLASFRACLHQHGVTLPARPPGSGRPPGGGGLGFFGGGGGAEAGRGDLAARDPKLAAAIRACGGFRGARRFRVSRAAIANYVACVRQHGYNLPNPNFSGRGPVFPPSIRSDPKFQSASRACQNLLIRPQTETATTARS